MSLMATVSIGFLARVFAVIKNPVTLLVSMACLFAGNAFAAKPLPWQLGLQPLRARLLKWPTISTICCWL